MAFSLHPADVAFGAALAFIAGLFVAGAGWPFYIFLAAIPASAAITIIIRRSLWRECALFASAFFCGIFYFHAFYAVKAAQTNLPIGKRIAFAAVIVGEPQPTEKYLMLAARAEPPQNGAFTIFAPLAAGYDYGDLVNLSGTLIRSDEPYGDPVMFSPAMALAGKHRGFFLREWMIGVKSAALARYREILGENEAALLGGITLGSRASFSQDIKDEMSLSGTTHIVAVSGYNITIVVVAVGALCGRFFSRRTTAAVAAGALVLFMFMVGAMASAVRAAIMGTIALLAREMGESYSIRNPVTFTALIMALFEPSALAHDVGFALSFASLLGIIYVGPALRGSIGLPAGADNGPSGAGFFGWKESAITTVSAQSAVMPILLRAFGRFSLSAVGANILILFVVPITMLFGFVLAVAGFLPGAPEFFAAKFVGILLDYELLVIRLFARLAAPLPLEMDSTLAVVLYYAVLSMFAFGKRPQTKPYPGQ